MEPQQDERQTQHGCLECNLNYSNIFNLRRHVRKVHPQSVDVLAPMKKTDSQVYNYSCSICTRNFSYKKNFNHHMKTCHGEFRCKEECDERNEESNEINTTHNEVTTCGDSKRIRRKSTKCPMCDYSVARKEQLIEHFKTSHNVQIVRQQIEFFSQQQFDEWKCETECNNNSKFVVEKIEKLKGKTVIYYACHRSGNYRPEGKGLRRLKTQGSCKINAYCPASIKKTEHSAEKIDVSYIETHIGHELELRHLQLTREENNYLAMKIAAKIPFDIILDDIRQTISSEELKRIHLITKKDLFNIQQSFNLPSVLPETKDLESTNEMEEPSKSPLIVIEDGKRYEVQLKKEIAFDSFEEENEQTEQTFLRCFGNLKSISQLELIKKTMAPISPILADAPSSGTSTKASEDGLAKLKMIVKRRQISAKKASKKRKYSANQTEFIAVNLLDSNE